MINDIEPVRISTARKPANAERIHVYSIDETDYFMPKVIPGALALQVLEVIRTEGQASATAWILRETLGDEAYDALRTCKTATLDEIKQVMGIVTKHVLGQVESGTVKN